ncbi:MAG TPA: ANTAR domain-containing protein [Armatimonadota bacterium]|nr:ANTAR domain-containing protein [Armatimonadota bacterium]
MTHTENGSRADPVPAVLVSDPDPVLRQSIAAALQRGGYRVLAQAESGDEALGLARKLSLGALVLGQQSADGETLETVRAVRASVSTAVILLAPIPNVGWIRSARGAGIDALLGRPPREGDLLAAVEMSLAHRQAARDGQAEVAALKERLDTLVLIQEAKELLMRNDRISDTEAYQRLRRQAERSGRPLKSVAEAVLLAARAAPTM